MWYTLHVVSYLNVFIDTFFFIPIMPQIKPSASSRSAKIFSPKHEHHTIFLNLLVSVKTTRIMFAVSQRTRHNVSFYLFRLAT